MASMFLGREAGLTISLVGETALFASACRVRGERRADHLARPGQYQWDIRQRTARDGRYLAACGGFRTFWGGSVQGGGLAINRLWYFFVLNLAKFMYFLLGGIRTKGKMLMSGPLIVAPVHLSHLDPPAVACGCNRMLRFMAKKTFRGAFGWLIRSLGAFPVNRGEGDMESIRFTMTSLEKGEAVIIFPEGTRGDGKRLGPLSKGVALIAKNRSADHPGGHRWDAPRST